MTCASHPTGSSPAAPIHPPEARATWHGATALLLALAACGPAEAPGVGGARNLLLISVDTLRADRLGCYGYPRPTTPFLDELAEEGVLFEDASAPSPWTMPSHASLFTGLYPSRNGVISMRHGIAEGVETAATLLARAGFATGAVVSNSLLTDKGLESGFTFLEEADKGGPHPSAVSERAGQRLRELDRGRPFFLLVHYIDPHSDYAALPEFAQPFLEPYDGPADGSSGQLFEFVQGQLELSDADGRHLSNLYDGAVRQLDEEVRELFDVLRAEELLDETLVILTSDHGEEFLEHGGLMHGQTQYDEVLRVPLLMLGPGLPRGLRVPDPVALIDVLPTALEELGLPVPTGLDGLSLRPTFDGQALPPRPLVFEADLDPPTAEAGVLTKGTERALRRGHFKLHYDRRSKETRLFDLASDPGEERDVSAQHPERTAELLAELQAFLRSMRDAPAPALTDEDLERLRDLGYAGEE